MSFDFKWTKLRPSVETRILLERAVDGLNHDLGLKFHLIKHPFGKIIACQVADFWLFHVGDGGRPPLLWTVAVTTRPGQRFLLPTQKVADFTECCGLLGLQGEQQQAQFKNFLMPNTDRALASTVQGAS